MLRLQRQLEECLGSKNCPVAGKRAVSSVGRAPALPKKRLIFLQVLLNYV